MAVISVLIPVHNCEQYLKRCLLSLSNSTLINDCEIVFIDDCSTDHSYEMLQKYLETDFVNLQKNTKIYRNQQNAGVSETRNLLIEKSCGEYIAFVDSDDWIESDYFEKLYQAAVETDADIVGCNRYDEYSNDKHVFVKDYFCSDVNMNLQYLLEGKLFGTLHSRLIKRSLIQENNISFVSGNNVGEDALFLEKLIYNSKINVKVENPLYHYVRYNQSSLCSSMSMKSWNERAYNINEMIKFLDDRGYEKKDSLMCLKANSYLLAIISNDKEIRDKFSEIYKDGILYLNKIEMSKFAKIYIWFYIHNLKVICYFLRTVKGLLK